MIAEKEPVPFTGTGRFRVVRPLGSGAFGAVYEVEDRERGGHLALKVLARGDVDATARFKREFRALAGLSHPNLLTLHELVSEGDLVFFTMELVDGTTLLEWSRPSGTLDPVRLRRAFIQLTDGLVALHDSGKLHRDIKPSNILVTRDGRVKVLDFGLVSEGGEGEHLAVGTPAFMAPEQAAGEPATEASDWYAVGAVLYEVLTGRLPFAGDSLEVMVAKQWFDPPPPREVDPAVPPELDSLCRALMKRDPAERPSGREVRRRLAGPGHDDSTGRFRRMALGRGPFVGRREELRLLRRAYERVRAGSAASVYVTGRSGLGKSALVRRFLEDLSRADPPPVVLSGRCLPQESVPFKAVDGLVDALATYLSGLPGAERRALIPGGFLALSRLFPVLGDLPDVEESGKEVLEIPDVHELRRRAFGALRGLLARLAVDRPVILFVDDLQWGDADSALLFGEVLQAPCPPGLLAVTAYRSEERDTNALLLALRASLATPDTTEITLNELNEEEAADLVTLLADETGPVSRKILTELARDAAGNPLFLQELVRDARRRAGEGQSRPLQEVLLARVEGLGEEARALLRAVAVSGAPVPAAVAREAARLSDEDSAVTALLNERFVRTRSRAGESEIEPFHEKIREAALSGLSPAEKRILHGRLARAFATRREPDAERLLLHFREADEAGEAAVWAEHAAEKAFQTLAFERAAQLFREARELFLREGTIRRDLLVRLGESLAAAGRGPDAAHAFLEAAEAAPAEEEGELLRLAAEQLLRSGHVDEGLDVMRRVLSAVGLRVAPTPGRALASLVANRIRLARRGLAWKEAADADVPKETLARVDAAWSMAVGLGVVDSIRGADFNARHLLLALDAGEPYRVSRALALEAAYSASEGLPNRKRTERLLIAVREAVEKTTVPHARALELTVRGISAALEGRFGEACLHLEEAETYLLERCSGVAWELFTARYFDLLSRFYLGDLRALAARTEDLVRESEERGDLYAATSLMARIGYAVRLAEDDAPAARRDLATARGRWSREGFHLQHVWCLFGEMETALYDGDARHALTRWEEEEAEVKKSLLLRIQLLRIGAVQRRARAALAVAAALPESSEERDTRLASVRSAARSIAKEGTSWGAPWAALLTAGERHVAERDDEALAALDQAVLGFTESGMAAYHAAALVARGRLRGGEEGAREAEEGLAWLARQDVRNPEALARLFAPALI